MAYTLLKRYSTFSKNMTYVKIRLCYQNVTITNTIAYKKDGIYIVEKISIHIPKI